MKKMAIVAVGYNRPKSMERLLRALERAEYDSDEVKLYISIDHSGTDDVERMAEAFQWSHGDKEVRTYPERMGLKKHILHCGSFLEEYDAIAVFEDDVVPAPGFYMFMKESVERYADEEDIAGISLYSYLWNGFIGVPFVPEYTEHDVYFIQYAQSWGQIWMKKQWKAFTDWLREHDTDLQPQENMPSKVARWPKSSWLKYHIKYCVDTNKFFVYPYRGLATCYSEVGEHAASHYTHVQIPMMMGMKIGYRLPLLGDEHTVKYDSFLERIPECKVDGIAPEELCMDLYGMREGYMGRRYVVSSKTLPYKVVKSYALELRPQELNVFENIEGTDVHLYDTSEPDRPRLKDSEVSRFRYYFRLYEKTPMLLRLIKDKVTQKINRIRK